LIHGKFIPPIFGIRYQRNNKRGGLKNLRCFPICATHHKERGFCGRPVIIELVPSLVNKKDIKNVNSYQENFEHIFCWAEFTPIQNNLTIQPGSVTPLSTLLMKERSKDKPLNPYLRGKLMSKDLTKTKFGFNCELRGWHYSWASNKHSCNALHCLQVFVFKVIKCNGVNPEKFKESLNTKYVHEVIEANQKRQEIIAKQIQKKTKPTTASILYENKDVLEKFMKDNYINEIINPKQVLLECEAVFRSSTFRLFCRRRRRFPLEPTAPIAPPKYKNKKPINPKKQLGRTRSHSEGDLNGLLQLVNAASTTKSSSPLKQQKPTKRMRTQSEVLIEPSSKEDDAMLLLEIQKTFHNNN
jgi:hypothetical protein